MATRLVAFDLETAKVLPSQVGDLLAHRPLGIACAAAVVSGEAEPLIWHGAHGGRPSAQMSRVEVCSMLEQLKSFVDKGYTLVTWNGLSFDFDVLAEESGLPSECAELALDHVDMMFHAVCQLGHYLSLGKAAEGLGVGEKSGSGSDAPAMWAEGRFDEVLRYNVQDAKLTLAVAEESQRRSQLVWMTARGQARSMPLPRGWYCVRDACQIPPPDTSWMDDPPSREDFMKWLPRGLHK
jgi:RNase_H superfamily